MVLGTIVKIVYFFYMYFFFFFSVFFFVQAEDGIRDLVRSRGLGDVYKRQVFDPVGQQPAISGIHGCHRQIRSGPRRTRVTAPGLSLIHI